MNPFIDQMLSQVYELEGLMLVLERHKGDSSDFIYEMVRRKVERISELAPMCTPDIFARENAQKEEFAPVEDSDEVVEVDEPETTASAETCVESDEFCESDNDYVDQIPDDSQYIDVIEEPEPIVETEVEDNSFTEAEIYVDFNEEEIEHEEVEEEELDEIFDKVEDTEQIEDEFCGEAEETENFEAENDEFEIDSDDFDDEVVTVEEALQRNLSKDLSKAFTLNDHFRYRRELFGNSEMEMRNTINMVEAMRSFAEAEEYFYGDLEWDSESPEVADFMAIIKKHFL